MSEHPGPEDLEAFLRADLPERAMRGVFAHLLSGCPTCAKAMGHLSPGFFRPSFMHPREDASEYDFPIARAIRGALKQAAARGIGDAGNDGNAGKCLLEIPAERSVPEAPSLPLARPHRPLPVTPVSTAKARCEALLETVRSLRHRDSEAMVMVATYTAALADRLEPADGPPAVRTDLQARAWAELGNARRVAGDLAGAEADLGRAIERAELGTGDPLLLARLMDLTASLYRATGRFAEAHRLLDGVHTLYRDRGDLHSAGRALIGKGISVGAEGDPEAAIALLDEGIRTIEAGRDPLLLLAGAHSLISFLVEAGRFAEGERLIRATRPLYRRWADSHHLLKLEWIEGRIAAGQGEPGRAEAIFESVRQAFAERQMPFTAAVAAFDLAALWLERGKTAAVREMVEDLLVTFRILGLRREAIAALLLLREAVRTERLTFALLKKVTAQFQRLEREPAREPEAE